MDAVLQTLQIDRILDAFKLDKLRHTRLFIPSWCEMYLVDSRVCSEGNGNDDDGDARPESSFEDDTQEKFNIAPVVFGAIALITCVPQILGQGVESFWAAAKERAGIHSLRHYRTLYMAGELEHLESISGIMNAVCQGRMFLVWGVLATITYGSTKHLTSEDAQNDGDDDDTLNGGNDTTACIIYDREDSTGQMARHPTEPAPAGGQFTSMYPPATNDTLGAGFAVTYSLTLPPADFRRFLSIVGDALPTHIIKELSSHARASSSEVYDRDANVMINSVETGQIKEAIPSGTHIVGIIVKSSSDSVSTDTVSYEKMRVTPGPVTYVFAKKVHQIPFCDEFFHTMDLDLPDAAEALVEYINTSSNQQNPLESLS